MKTSSHTDASFLQQLMSRGADLIARATASIKSKHRAGEIAAAVAVSNNPTGA